MKKTQFENLLNRLEVKYEKVNITKNNNVMLEGYQLIFKPNLRPTIYIDQIEAGDEISLTRLVMEEKAKMETFPEEIFENKIFTKEYIKETIRCGSRNIEMNINDEDTVCRVLEDFKEIESYLYILLKKEDCERLGAISETATIKVNYNLLEKLKISEKEAWKWAKENMLEELEIKTMFDTLKELMPFETDEIMDFEPEQLRMFVVSNKNKELGAGQLINMDKIKEYVKDHKGKNFAILPSSIHEVLLIITKEYNMDELDSMVKEVNRSQVQPKERLADRAFGIFEI